MTEALVEARPRRVGWVPILWIMGFHAGALLAFVPAYFTWQALAVCFLLHGLTTCLGISMTYHRLLSHRSFVVKPKWLEYVLTAFASCAAQGDALGMVSDHRRHHFHTDEDFDTHSPTKGFFWAHFFWWWRKEDREIHDDRYYRRWAPDLFNDPVHRWLSQWHFIFPVGLCVALYAIGGMPWLVWGGFVRTTVCIHTTWAVNSVAHTWGYRNYETNDLSRNSWWIALVTYGEGWHNNHHAVETSAMIGEKWWEIDLTYSLIALMERLGLAEKVRVRDCSQPKIARRREMAGVAVESR